MLVVHVKAFPSKDIQMFWENVKFQLRGLGLPLSCYWHGKPTLFCAIGPHSFLCNPMHVYSGVSHTEFNYSQVIVGMLATFVNFLRKGDTSKIRLELQ